MSSKPTTQSYLQKGELSSTTEISNHDIDSIDERALVRKIDSHLLPAIWLMYFLSYVDRTNIGNAEEAGMQEDLHLSSGQYSLALIVFFITYVLFEVPSNLWLSTTRPSVYLPTIMVIWGTLTCCMAAVKSYKQLIALRTVLGFVEAGFSPGVIFLFSSWYRRDEQSKRFAVYLSAAILSGAFGGLLAGGILDSLEGAHGIRGWRWLFIIEGVVSIGWAFVSYFLLLDFPANSSRLSDRERALAVSRLELDREIDWAGGETDLGPLRALKMALADHRTWFFTLGYMSIVGASTLQYFYPTLVSGLGYKGTKAQYMTVPIYAVAFVCNAFTGYFSDRFPHRRGLVIASWLTLSMSCSITVCAVYGLKARTLGDGKRGVTAVALAFVNAMGNLAQIYGAYLFPENDAPKYLMGFQVISAMCAFGVIVYGALYLLLKKQAGRI
ncbi:MFS transporter, ACS family, pantothenate transporter, partial [Lecanoromycetidae sp. Uapishka_2]